MRSRFPVIALVVFALLAAASLGYAAAVKQYQYTGTVTEVSADTLSVDKGGEIWSFSLADLKGAKVAKGDKVTVYYRMVATKIEPKK